MGAWWGGACGGQWRHAALCAHSNKVRGARSRRTCVALCVVRQPLHVQACCRRHRPRQGPEDVQPGRQGSAAHTHTHAVIRQASLVSANTGMRASARAPAGVRLRAVAVPESSAQGRASARCAPTGGAADQAAAHSLMRMRTKSCGHAGVYLSSPVAARLAPAQPAHLHLPHCHSHHRTQPLHRPALHTCITQPLFVTQQGHVLCVPRSTSAMPPRPASPLWTPLVWRALPPGRNSTIASPLSAHLSAWSGTPQYTCLSRRPGRSSAGSTCIGQRRHTPPCKHAQLAVARADMCEQGCKHHSMCTHVHTRHKQKLSWPQRSQSSCNAEEECAGQPLAASFAGMLQQPGAGASRHRRCVRVPFPPPPPHP